ncbi:MAG TPA: hypothetical protein PKZ75_13780 [Bacteroidia bacterium]|nr:hypothetical protein [Bacteroidia bacterium]
MKHITLLTFLFTNYIIFGQVQQWFPAKFSSETNKFIADTSGENIVSFIKVKNGLVKMYGNHTHYETEMKLIGDYYYSSHLTIGYQKDTLKLPFIEAKYYFYLKPKTSKLIIKRQNKTDTILFIKSTKPFIDINGKWG